jgi:hypothetical protein
MSVPTMAFAMPPPTSPTGLGSCVKNATLMAEAPCTSRNAKISTRGAMTRSAESAETADIAALVRWRRRGVMAINRAPGS